MTKIIKKEAVIKVNSKKSMKKNGRSIDSYSVLNAEMNHYLCICYKPN